MFAVRRAAKYAGFVSEYVSQLFDEFSFAGARHLGQGPESVYLGGEKFVRQGLIVTGVGGSQGKRIPEMTERKDEDGKRALFIGKYVAAQDEDLKRHCRLTTSQSEAGEGAAERN